MSEEVKPKPEAVKPDPQAGYLVTVTREPYMDFFTLTLPNGASEELEVEDTRAWFRERNADMDKIETMLDHVWNFYYGEVMIHNYVEPEIARLPHSPDI